MKSITLFDLVYNVYSNLGCLNVLKVKLLDELSKNFGNNELSYVSSFLSMSGNSNLFGRVVSEDVSINRLILESDSICVSVEMWKNIVEYIQYGHNVGLVNVAIIGNALVHKNKLLLENILKLGPYNIRNIIKCLMDYIDTYESLPEIALMDMFEKYLPKDQYESLIRLCLERLHSEDI